MRCTTRERLRLKPRGSRPVWDEQQVTMIQTNCKRLAFFLPSLGGGGAERTMLNLAEGFAQRGFQTDLVLANADGPYLSFVPSIVRIIDLKGPGVLNALSPLRTYLTRERPTALLSALNHGTRSRVRAFVALGGTAHGFD